MIKKLKPPKTLKSMSLTSKIKQRNKLIALFFIVVVILSISFSSVEAATTDVESTGATRALTVFPADTLEEYRVHQNIQRDFLRMQLFYDTWNLIKKYNTRTTQLARWLSVLDSDEYNENQTVNRKKAVSLSSKWDTLYSDILYLDGEVEITCFSSGNGRNLTWEDGSKVTNQDYNNMRKEITSCSSTLNSLYNEASKAYNERKSNDIKSISKSSNQFINQNYSIVTKMWNFLGKALASFGTGSSRADKFLGMSWGTNSMTVIADAIAPVTKAFAYCLIVVLFGLNLQNTMLQFEVMTPQGILKVFGSLLIAKVWVDVSINVCAGILSIVNSMNSQIFSRLVADSRGTFALVLTNSVNTTVENSWWDYFGALINFLTCWMWLLPELVLIVTLAIAIISVFIKIITREFELTCLLCVAPLAFSTIANEETKVYFKKFMGAFLSTALYMTFMMICYVIGTQWLAEANSYNTQNFSAYINEIMGSLPRFIIIFGICKIMRKPPKVLTNLID